MCSSIKWTFLLTLDLWQMKILLWENINSVATGFSIQVAMKIEVTYPATWITRRFFQRIKPQWISSWPGESMFTVHRTLCTGSELPLVHCLKDSSRCSLVVPLSPEGYKFTVLFCDSYEKKNRNKSKTATLEELKGGTYSCFTKKQTLFLLCQEVPPTGFSSFQKTEGQLEVLAQSWPGR